MAIVLIAPIHFSFGGDYAQKLNLQGRITWAGGLISLEMILNEGKTHLSFGLLGLKKAISVPEKKAAPKKKRSSGKGPLGNISSFINRQLFTAVKVVLQKLLRALHLHFNLSGLYGFDDPSLTGVMVGTIAALNLDNSSIALDPDFTRAVIDIKGSFRGWFIPLHILAIGIVFLFKKPVRAIWWPKIKFKKKQKEDVQYA